MELYNPVEMEAELMMSSMENLNLKTGMAGTSTTTNGEEEEDEGIPQDIESPAKEIEGSDKVQFHPPAYRQRYAAVREVLSSFLEDPRHKDTLNGNTVMEVGCAEYGMYFFYKSMLELGKVIFMDLDEQLLEERKYYLKPLPIEHLQKITRPKPLVMEAYAGCITKVDSRIIKENPKVWAIVGIELIEHLYPHVLRGFEISVFGVIAPQLVVVTTPNSDFNPVFNLPPGKFRHWDHKFEWSREEFVAWCEKICSEFLEYRFKIAGICSGPPETDHLGCVSQMAIFEKIETGFIQNNNPVIYPGVVQDDAYKLIESIEYPNYVEQRTEEQIVLQEFNYTVRTYWLSRRNIEHYMEMGKTELCFSLKELPGLLRDMPAIVQNPEAMKNVLSAGNYNIRVDEHGEYSVVLPISHWDDWGDQERDSFEDEDEEEMDDQPCDNVPCVMTEADLDSWE